MKEEVADLSVLEPGQLTEAAKKPLRRRNSALTRNLALSGLRVYVLIAVPLVTYAFFHALLAPQS